ncbi:MAG: bifunctional phosphopantothenoylcysteine decarboxylase/phosphopantothenate--cysteine ligase CoaBC [Deltaproteobacteria bacterium]|nr:bifunctional phosphopantothenoylcysteine decarboxylase/phosphopantothenate--cysteine ligase CoaBC [Deltaproteobacteria bacterium]
MQSQGWLGGCHVIVGVSGSVACYRACDLVRDLRGLGATVRAAPTRAAQAFVTPLLLEALSGTPCLTSALDLDQGRIPHVEEAYRASVVVVAPASADILAKMAAGFADEAILSLLLSFAGPVVVAPAMETHMWLHPATQANVAQLQSRGVVFVGPVEGPLASGRTGSGRLAPLEDIVEAVVACAVEKDLSGIRAVVTAGPTVEAIDPVRSITNRSSGRMGVAVARAMALRGARVTLVHGPLRQPPSKTPGLVTVAVRSAAEMAGATFAAVDAGCDVAVLAAAVADYTPARVAPSKIKKAVAPTALELVRTTDILATLGARPVRPLLVGFAAETERVEEAAAEKRARKACALVVGNDVSGADADAGFDVDTNRVFLARDPALGPSEWLPLLSKDDVAWRLADELRALLRRSR